MKFLPLKQRLAQRQQLGLRRHRLTVGNAQQKALQIGNAMLLNFASNDYLGLANSQVAKQALIDSARVFGFGSGASHLICGHQKPHDELESAMADFLERDAALAFSSGYMANLAVLQCLAEKGDLIIADKLNHASLIDGSKLSNADTVRYPHCDLAALERRLKRSPQNKFVVTDSVFSMDGDIAPLVEISQLCERHHAILIVDDAHGFGVLGEYGRGCTEYFELSQKKIPVLMTTLGKALGGYGAVVSGDAELVDYLQQYARSYIYTTAMPAANASANLANLQRLANESGLVSQLRRNINEFKLRCKALSITLVASSTAIQPIIVGGNHEVVAINQRLQESGILVGAIRPPTVPEKSARLRITISAEHTPEDIENLAIALSESFQFLEKNQRDDKSSYL